MSVSHPLMARGLPIKRNRTAGFDIGNAHFKILQICVDHTAVTIINHPSYSSHPPPVQFTTEVHTEVKKAMVNAAAEATKQLQG